MIVVDFSALQCIVQCEFNCIFYSCTVITLFFMIKYDQFVAPIKIKFMKLGPVLDKCFYPLYKKKS